MKMIKKNGCISERRLVERRRSNERRGEEVQFIQEEQKGQKGVGSEE